MARKQDWSPRAPGAPPRYEPFEAMAREMVGDGKQPNLFFVAVAGNIVSISLDFRTAYAEWRARSLGLKIETSLEDRRFGVIASVEPEEDNDSKLVRRDDSRDFIRMYGDDIQSQEE